MYNVAISACAKVRQAGKTLQLLSEMHARSELTDEEFSAAKRKVLFPAPPAPQPVLCACPSLR